VYFVRTKYKPELDPDALEEEEYRGETIVYAENVPAECGKAELNAWLAVGIQADDPETIAAKLEIEDRQSMLQYTMGAIEAVSNEEADESATIDAGLQKMQDGIYGLQRRRD